MVANVTVTFITGQTYVLYIQPGLPHKVYQLLFCIKLTDKSNLRKEDNFSSQILGRDHHGGEGIVEKLEVAAQFISTPRNQKEVQVISQLAFLFLPFSFSFLVFFPRTKSYESICNHVLIITENAKC